LTVKFYIDVGPLHEKEYTGIPHVAAKLCELALGDLDIEPAFFYNRHEVPISIVSQLLEARTGTLLQWASRRYCFQPLVTAPERGEVTVGLHTNIKMSRRLFPFEGQIIHDLTTIVTPQYHTAETNAAHQSQFYGDLLSNDVIFAVSESTATDVRTYFPETRAIPLVVAHLGADWDHVPEAVCSADLVTEDYIFILGTIEPRKNVAIILDLLQERPEIARQFRLVFGGRIGWGDAFEQQLARRGLLPLLENGRILKAGFVSEAAKYLLIKNAAAVIYPSLYEGFGLPVAEAVSLGTPVVTTASSSIPEVGREFANYFDPSDVDSLAEALLAAVRRGRNTVSRSGESLADWSAHFSWSRCYDTIKRALIDTAQPVAD
jgi:glycosyltransferase involved in cell wall biosynthesis